MVPLLVSLFFFSSTARSSNVVTFPLNEIQQPRCEILLSAARLKRFGFDTHLFTRFNVRARLNPDATDAALRALNLDSIFMFNVVERLAVSMRKANGNWWLEIVARPENGAWFRRSMEGLRMHEWTYFDQTQVNARSYGVRWSGGPHGSRYYFSVRMVDDERHYALGLDAPCARVRQLSLGQITETVSDGEDWFCRIPVLTFRRKR